MCSPHLYIKIRSFANKIILLFCKNESSLLFLNKSVSQIKNRDNFCCPRAVVVALTYPEEKPPITTIFKNIFAKNEKIINRSDY